MSTHTPGPWTAIPDSGEDSEGDWYVLTEKEAAIAVGLYGPDARLIAAAPTMYDYLAKRAAAGDEEAAQILGGINGPR